MAPRASAHDPYRTFKFRVRFGNTTVAGVTKVSPLSRSVNVTELREGGDLLAARQNPGTIRYEDVTLERGRTADRQFEDWANLPARLHLDPSGVSGFKRTVFIDVFDLKSAPADRASTPVVTYKLLRCWVTRYVALPDLDASANAVALESITLRHEGWERVR